MIATVTHATKHTSHDMPNCPHCDSNEYVRKAGYGGRRHIAQYRCHSRQCAGKWFLDPSRTRTHRAIYREPPPNEIAFCLTSAEKPKFAAMLEHRRNAEPSRQISAGDFCHEIVSTAIARVDSMRREHRLVDIWNITTVEK
jgi:hypothetical protein